MKGGAECARSIESDIERDLGDRCAPIRQQGLGAPDPAPRPVTVRRRSERLLERSQEMIRAQLREIGQRLEGDVLGKVLLHEIQDALLLPSGKPATHGRPWRWSGAMQTQKLDRKSTRLN